MTGMITTRDGHYLQREASENEFLLCLIWDVIV